MWYNFLVIYIVDVDTSRSETKVLKLNVKEM